MEAQYESDQPSFGWLLIGLLLVGAAFAVALFLQATETQAPMPVPGVNAGLVDDVAVNGQLVPGVEGVDDMVVEGSTSSGMVVPGFEGDVVDMVVENDS